jgi:A/G-specific adenine glycosylase
MTVFSLDAGKSANSDHAFRLIAWQLRHGRHDLPWQGTRDPYRIWVSEIMLQQTQVATVIGYFRRFLARFPAIADLAAAPEDEVLRLWSGLGYYGRARNLHRAARLIMERHGGAFPREFDAIAALPGIGRSTAAAIAAFAFGERRAILDGNVKRVLARRFGVEGYPGEPAVEKRLWALAEALLPKEGIETYTQALMDLGAAVCLRSSPRCTACPLQEDCVARQQNRQRELPGPRPRKTLPEKHTVMLILRHGPDVLLEKRPSAGLWGGLWSLPEIRPEDDPEAVCLTRFGLKTRRLPALAGLTHTFTHFQLRITPQPMAVQTLPHGIAEPGTLWLPLEESIEAAIPAPVRTLLKRVLSPGNPIGRAAQACGENLARRR